MNQLHSSLESNNVEDLRHVYGNRQGGEYGEMDTKQLIMFFVLFFW